jgi:hypothetical protein
MIVFEAYPPGSAVFIYFMSRLFGFIESYSLMAQALLIGSALAVTFLFYSWKNKLALILTFITGVILLNAEGGFYSLQVDTLLAVLGLAGTLVAIYYRQDLVKLITVLTPISILTLLVKNSGVFFLTLNCILVIVFYFKYKLQYKSKRLPALGLILFTLAFIPAISLTAWNGYTDKAYIGQYPESTPHAISLQGYTASYQEKSVTFKRTFSSKFISATTNIHKAYMICLIAINLLLALLCLIYLNKDRKKMWRLLFSLFYIDGAYILYSVGLYLTFLFSMSEIEGNILNSLDRYETVASIYIIGISTTIILSSFQEQLKIQKNYIDKAVNCMAVLLFFGFAVVCSFGLNIKSLLIQPNIRQMPRYILESQLKHANIDEGESDSAIYTNFQYDSAFMYFFLSYDLLSKNVNSLNPDSLKQAPKNCYIITFRDVDQATISVLPNYSTSKDCVNIYQVDAQHNYVKIN